LPRWTDCTHVEDVKDPIEVLPPSSNHILVVLRAKESRDRISFSPLDDLPLDLGHGSAIETSGEGTIHQMHSLFNSRSQFPDGPKHGLTKFIQSLPIQPPVKGLTYIPTRYSKLDVILLVRHVVLNKRESGVRHRGVGENVP
jgi:hypothetical protein